LPSDTLRKNVREHFTSAFARHARESGNSSLLRHFRESGNPWTLFLSGPYPMTSDHKSRHDGFVLSMSSTFHALFHFLMRFSRKIADSIVECSSYHTNRVIP
jgi:hypothetical protein